MSSLLMPVRGGGRDHPTLCPWGTVNGWRAELAGVDRAPGAESSMTARHDSVEGARGGMEYSSAGGTRGDDGQGRPALSRDRFAGGARTGLQRLQAVRRQP